MNELNGWDNAFTAGDAYGTVKGSPSHAGATLATEFLRLFAANPHREARQRGSAA